MATFIVTNSNDSGAGSLREAVTLANANADSDTIVFQSAGVIGLTSGELEITQDVTIDGDIDGDGRADIAISAADDSRIFNISGATTDVDLISLTLTDGDAKHGLFHWGGAVYATNFGTLDIVNSTIKDSQADSGAGLFVLGGTVRVVNSTISGNVATYSAGGGIYALDIGGGTTHLYLYGATVSGNTAINTGAGLNIYGASAVVSNSTITGNTVANSGGGGIDVFGNVQLDVRNTVVANNFESAGTVEADIVKHNVSTVAADHSFFGTLVAIDVDTGGNTTDGGDPGLDVLADNGGPVWTHAILAGSPLIGAGDASLLPLDDLDVDGDGITSEPLPVDATGVPLRSTLDIGAVQSAPDLVVTSDADDAATGDFAADSADGLTLREAIFYSGHGRKITFDNSLYHTTIDLDTELVLSRDVMIDGDIDHDGRADVFLAGHDRIFRVTGTGTDVSLRAVYMGYGSDTNGGLIATELGTTLTVVNSMFISGLALGNGGAVDLGGSGTFVNSIFLANGADAGGAIYVQAGQALHLINTTIIANYANAGGAIATGAGVSVAIDQSTIVRNYGYQYAGGVDMQTGTTLQVANSVIAGNYSAYGPTDISTSAGSASMYVRSSVIGTGVDVATVDSNSSVIASDNPGIAFLPLGPGTFAVIPTDGSPLLNAGDDGRVPFDVYDIDNDGDTAELLPLDSRGAPRITGAHVDIGAAERLSLGDVGDVTEDNTPATGNVLSNDAVLDEVFGYAIGVVAFPGGSLSSPGDNLEGAYGTFTMSSTGAWTYTLHNNNNAVNALRASDTLTDTFTYFAGKGALFAELAQLTITIHGANDAPTVNNDILAATEDTPITFTAAQLIGNDTDPDTGTSLSIASVTSGTGGTVVLNLDGTVTFTPTLDFNGAATFTYKTRDNAGGQSTAASVTVNVGAVNDAPVISSNGGGATATIGVAENSTAVTTVTSTDVDGPARTYALAGNDAALFSLNATTGALAFLAARDFEGTPNDANLDGVYDVTVTASDGALTDTQALAITVTNVVGHTINGNKKADTIDGTEPAGNATTSEEDTIDGKAGNDTIKSGAGNDTVKGGAGIDKLNGGSGIDTVDYSDMTAGVVLTLDGKTEVRAFIGGIKDDTLKNFENITGGKSNDTLTGDTKDNLINGRGGDDLLDGDKGADTINGGSGNDTITGGRGNDMLRGGAGNDEFVFNAKLSANNVDVIADFKHSKDVIHLGDAIFTAIGPTLEADEFFAKPGAVKAKHADDHIIYNTTTGDLYYDAGGKGGKAAIHFATLTDGSKPPPLLDAGDFVIV